MAERIKLGGLWANKAKDGTTYLSGKLSPTVKILIFTNNYKTGDNQPTHVMYLAPIEPDPNAPGRTATPEADPFFGEVATASGGDTEAEGDDYADAPAPARTPAPRPAAAPAQRPAPAPAPPRPMTAATTNTRPAPQNNGAAQPARSRPAPPPVDDAGDFEDPFGE